LQMSKATRNDMTYSVLDDPIEDAMGPRMTGANAYLHTMDAVASVFPLIFMLISFMDLARAFYHYRKNNEAKKNGTKATGNSQVLGLQTWTKVMVSAGLLFALKGTVGAITLVPDSSGWAVCKARLTADGVHPDGLAWMEQEHTLWDMVSLDYVFVVGHGHPLRYCADMMYSGHTFVVTLFALGAYEQLRIVLSRSDVPCPDGEKEQDEWNTENKHRTLKKMGALLLLSTFAIGEQCLEIYFVERTRFHYTMDVVMAMVMVFLVFTNGPIAVFAKQWEQRGLRLLQGRQQMPNPHMTAEQLGEDMHWWNSRGDIFIPPCCVPFCCFAGREHLYSDRQLHDIVCKYKNQMEEHEFEPCFKKKIDFLAGAMNLHEGVSALDLEPLMPDVLHSCMGIIRGQSNAEIRGGNSKEAIHESLLDGRCGP